MSISWPFREVRNPIGASRRRPAVRTKSVRVLPFLESLEDRAVPAFIAPVDVAAGLSITSSAVADFNGDGFKDIVVAGSISGRGEVEVILNNHDGTYTAEPMYATGNSPIQVEVGDFDGDGRMDVVTRAAYYTGALTVNKGNGDGTFQAYTPYTVLAPTSVEVRDVNGDGRDDVVTTDPGYNTIGVYLSGVTGTLGPKTSFSAGSYDISSAIGDLNGDGKLDIVTTNLGAAAVSVELGTGTGTFLPPTSYPAGPGNWALTLADFNGDGKVDVATSNSSAANTVSVLLGNGDGSFQPPVSYSSGTGTSYQNITAGDLNGDGKVDLVERSAVGFSVIPGNGDGTFAAPIAVSSGASSSLSIGDFNNDGGLDAVTTTSAGVASILLNDNSGLNGVVTTADLSISAPATTAAGADLPVTVTVLDKAGLVKTDFVGAVVLGSSDARGSSVTYNFTAADAGVHTIATGLRLVTAGPQSISATSPFVGAASQLETVATGPAARLVMSTTTPGVVAGTDSSFRLATLDAFGNMGADYAGTVHFSSSDVQAGLPADYTFTAADSGVHNFTVNLKTANSQYVAATDSLNSALNGILSMYVTPLAATHLSVVGGGGSIGVFRPVSVIAKDMYENTATGFSGVVHFTGTDPATVLPADTTLVGGSAIVSVKLLTEGAQTLTATAVADPTKTGSEVIDGTTAGVGSFVISGFPSTVAGTAGTFTVQAIDVLGKPAVKYNGMVTFRSSDFQAGLPLAYTFTTADAGVHTFSATLKTAGSQSLTIFDNLAGAFGSQSGIAVKAAAATSLTVSGPTSAVAGVAIPVTVMVRDAYGNLATGYTGKVKFSTNDTLAATGLPTDYTFTPADAGSHVFNVVLKTANTKTALTTVTVTDASNIALTSTLGGIDVVNGVATQIVLTPPSNLTAGTAFSLKVSVLDAFGNRVKNYTGTVHFKDSVAATGLPADYTFNAADAGIHTFNVTLSTAGAQTLSVYDLAVPSMIGTTSVNPKAAGGGGGGGGGKPVV